MNTPIGNIELCAEGRQIVAPPSTHPDTRQPYIVEKPLEILRVPNLAGLADWVDSFKPKQQRLWQPPSRGFSGNGSLNPRLIEAIARHFEGLDYKSYGDWLHGQCVHPQNHKHGDRNPSFGFNVRTGYGHCHVCGTMLAKDICEAIGIRAEDHGGLIDRSTLPSLPQSSIDLSQAPPPDKPPKNDDNSPDSDDNHDDDHDDEPPDDEPSIDDLDLPDWLRAYIEWASATANQTPMSFHLGAGLWLLSVAIGRRLYGAAPWGIHIYPNLYIVMIAGTTYYRKSTAYKLAEKIARASIPHMLMPKPGSPERFQESLSGKLPVNFEDLSDAQQTLIRQGLPFASQRGLLKDEIAGLFGTINKREYMAGMKDLIMEL